MALGKSDYGLWGLVGGLTAFITFFNSIVGGAVARFFAVSVGKEQTSPIDGLEECRMWFTTAVIVNTVLPLILMLVGYPLGVYAVKNWLIIPPDRIVACIWVWRFVCVTCFLGMISIPLNAMYTAKQYIAELTIYSFVTTTLNACFLYYMITHPAVWLTKYALWQCLLGVLPNLIIGIRGFYLFPECRFRMKYVHCWNNVKQLAAFGLWGGWGALGALLRAQGSAILINVNYGPVVNAGVAVGSSLSAQCNMLSGSMVGAFSPAIYNSWGAGKFDEARTFAYRACKFGTLFVLVFAIPLCLEVEEVLRLWLKNPPAYASGICLFVLAMNIIDKMATGHQIVVHAKGKIAMYQAFLGTSLVMTLPLAWALIRFGVGPYSIGWAMVAMMFFCAAGRVWFARTLVGMSARYWCTHIAAPLVGMIAVVLPLGYIPHFIMERSFLRVCSTTLVVEILLLPISWYFVLDKDERAFVMLRLKSFASKMGF